MATKKYQLRAGFSMRVGDSNEVIEGPAEVELEKEEAELHLHKFEALAPKGKPAKETTTTQDQPPA